jgi:hypothetical protein
LCLIPIAFGPPGHASLVGINGQPRPTRFNPLLIGEAAPPVHVGLEVLGTWDYTVSIPFSSGLRRRQGLRRF